jgi:hypothetical protein
MYMPDCTKLVNECEGTAAEPFTPRKGASMPPLPERDKLSVISVPKSGIVSLAHALSITVPVTTGLPETSVYVPFTLRGIS